MPKNMLTRRVNDLVILRQTKETPTDAEWDECLKLLHEQPERLEQVKVLVITDGGGPTVEQRQRLKDALEGFSVPVAVVTDSMRVRFIVSSVALVTSRIQSFPPSDLEGAYRHLGLGLGDQRAANKEVKDMTEALNSPMRLAL